MPRMHAPRATFCEKSPSLKFVPHWFGQQPLKAATTSPLLKTPFPTTERWSGSHRFCERSSAVILHGVQLLIGGLYQLFDCDSVFRPYRDADTDRNRRMFRVGS